MEITKLKPYLSANLRPYVGKFTVEFFYSGQRDGADGYDVRIDGTVRQVFCSDLLPHEEE